MITALSKPNGSSKLYIIQCSKPNLKFVCVQNCPEWLELQAEEKAGTLHHRFPNIPNANAGVGMTEAMLAKMTEKFDANGEFITTDKEKAIIAFNAARDSDRNARLHSTSLPIEESLLRVVPPTAQGYVPPTKESEEARIRRLVNAEIQAAKRGISSEDDDYEN